MWARWRRSPPLQAEGKEAVRFPEYSAVPVGVPQFFGCRRGKLWLWKGHVVSKGTSHCFPAQQEREPWAGNSQKAPAASLGCPCIRWVQGSHRAGGVLSKSVSCWPKVWCVSELPQFLKNSR